MAKPDLSAARHLINSLDFGVLSTHSVKLEGFPFGSVVPYCPDGEGMPVVLISTIAQHTINLKANPRCSLTILHHGTDVQAHGRIGFIGNMEPLPADDETARERYFRYFPKSRSYEKAHDFSFFRLRPVSIRYIGGFGAIHWIEPDKLLSVNPFYGKAEHGVVEHMNEDHRDSLALYCCHFKGLEVTEEDTVRMVGIDAFGVDVYWNDQKVRLDFDEPATSPQDARMRLVAMSKTARAGNS